MSRRFRFSLKTLLQLTMLGISFAGTITRSFGEEDAGSSATPPAAQEKLLPDSAPSTCLQQREAARR
ncbi:MAG: hypothetical protein ACREHD_18400, partial [Pirellulales bacterium]